VHWACGANAAAMPDCHRLIAGLATQLGRHMPRSDPVSGASGTVPGAHSWVRANAARAEYPQCIDIIPTSGLLTTTGM